MTATTHAYAYNPTHMRGNHTLTTHNTSQSRLYTTHHPSNQANIILTHSRLHKRDSPNPPTNHNRTHPPTHMRAILRICVGTIRTHTSQQTIITFCLDLFKGLQT
ncbi:hypothetical protein PIB30_111974, partial [Stylosanthes scabra]|nr:hypothetical protein [Stylosanthes scabra]